MRTGHRIESAAAVVAAVVVVDVVFLRFQLGAAKLIILNIPRRIKKKIMESRNSLLEERRTRDRKVSSSNPGRRDGRIFFSRINFVC